MKATRKKIDPDTMLEILIEHGFVESTRDAFTPYKLAINPDTDRPYTIYAITGILSSNPRNRTFTRELKKCFQEYGIRYMQGHEVRTLCWDMTPTKLKSIEENLSVDLSSMSGKNRRRLSAYLKAMGKIHTKEELLNMARTYIEKRKKTDGDLRKSEAKSMTVESTTISVSPPSSSGVESVLNNLHLSASLSIREFDHDRLSAE